MPPLPPDRLRPKEYAVVRPGLIGTVTNAIRRACDRYRRTRIHGTEGRVTVSNGPIAIEWATISKVSNSSGPTGADLSKKPEPRAGALDAGAVLWAETMTVTKRNSCSRPPPERCARFAPVVHGKSQASSVACAARRSKVKRRVKSTRECSTKLEPTSKTSQPDGFPGMPTTASSSSRPSLRASTCHRRICATG